MPLSRFWSDRPLKNGLWLLALNLSLVTLFAVTFAATAFFLSWLDRPLPLLPAVILGFGILSVICWYRVGQGLPAHHSAAQLTLAMLIGFSPILLPTLYYLFEDSASQQCGAILLAPLGILATLAAGATVLMGRWRRQVKQSPA